MGVGDTPLLSGKPAAAQTRLRSRGELCSERLTAPVSSCPRSPMGQAHRTRLFCGWTRHLPAAVRCRDLEDGCVFPLPRVDPLLTLLDVGNGPVLLRK